MERLHIELPQGVKSIIRRLNSGGFEAYAVGGCVRDALLNKTPHDWDICSSALPEEVLRLFAPDRRVLETGLKHGTLTVREGEESYEVTTFRVDGRYSDARHPDSVAFVSNLRDDLARRDFTVNAMAYSEESGLLDYFGGAEDLQNRVLRCVGEADERFSEDALRILRALRFAAVLDFTVDPQTAASIHKNAELLKKVSAERISVELQKLLLGRACLPVLLAYADVLCVLIPELKSCIGFAQNSVYHQYDVYEHILRAVDAYHGDDITVKLTLLLHDIGKPLVYSRDERGGHFYGHALVSKEIAERVVSKLRLDRTTQRNIVELVELHDTPVLPTLKSVRRMLNKLGEEQFWRLLEVKRGDILAHSEKELRKRLRLLRQIEYTAWEVKRRALCFQLKDLKLNGNDLLQEGIAEGKEIGKLLNELLAQVLEGKLDNDREALLAYVRAHRQK